MSQAVTEITPTPAPEPKKKNWFLRHKVITGVLVLAAVGVAASSGDSTDPTAPAAAGGTGSGTSTTTEDKVLGIGDAARDGKFEFTVKKVAYSSRSVGNEYLSKSPQGQYLIVTLAVENVGDKPQTLFDDNQYAYVGERKYSADGEAAIFGGSDAWLADINPGNSVTGTVYFDLPKGAKADTLELHDSAFSGGVDVRVG